ncbi:tyrosine-protein phosphatase [Sphingomonas profundi]|uniref:tyrosine-protein phosphatase n=1 Tax=Alterirhizorhabdus profundi TaxID=2681549 RepID=UPI002410F80A|nr:tyrosine-protein phosphatase [Sphingomonas profundi]
MTVARRHIPLEGGSNMRDIGGYAGADGRTVRWGTIYRSGAISRLTAADWEWIDRRGIATVCDLRAREERDLAPTRWQGRSDVRRADHAYDANLLFGAERSTLAGVNEMETSLYLVFARLLAPSFRLFFGALLEGHVPLIVHCAAGQDRTGLAIGLLLTALGVAREDIIADYRLSPSLRRPENELDRTGLEELAHTNPVARFYVAMVKRRGPDVFTPRELVNARGEPLLDDAFAAIRGEWGSIEAYLEEVLGVGPTEIERLRALLLEDAGTMAGA